MPRGRTPGVVRAGFTLIEVLAVLAITVMISGLAFPASRPPSRGSPSIRP
ncbi:type II secretion system protein [Hankyongella ginsenosidimutans]|nr:prepilin-type N-terminal cleavage/methylation domain-containing protein [Hankyongella ginsenosidimutans]